MHSLRNLAARGFQPEKNRKNREQHIK